MRLTLRSLLAYLDDILDPAHAREIGQKIEESSVAKSLVEQIREVMRRRRLTAPDLTTDKDGIDVNKVAEYLDNTLPPAEIADVEKTCLESDVHLAEVAACHQILTLVLGEPVDVPPHCRQRMYGLTETAPKAVVAPQPSETGGNGQSAAEAAAVAEVSPLASAPLGGIADEQQWTGEDTLDGSMNGSSDDAFRRSIPDYLKPTPFWRRALPTASIVVVLLAWVGLFAIDPSFSPSSLMQNVTSDLGDQEDMQAVRDRSAEPLPSVPEGNEQAAASESGGEMQLAAAADAFRQAEGNDSLTEPGETVAKLPTGLDPQPPADEPETVPQTTATTEPTGPAASGSPPSEAKPAGPTTAAKPATTMPDAAKPKPAAEPVPADPAPMLPALAAKVVSADSIVLREDTVSKDWYLQPRQSQLQAGRWYACPQPYDADIEVAERNILATLLGGTRVRYMAPSAAGDFGFEIGQGHLILQLNDPMVVEGGTVLAVAIGDDLWRLELLTPETVCGVEVAPTPPRKFEQPPAPDRYQGGLYVRTGAIRFADADGRVRVINAGEWMPLTPSVREADALGTSVVQFSGGYPSWLAADRQPTRTERRYAAVFEREFDPEQNIALSIGPIVDSPDPTLSQYATETLAVTQQYGPLVAALGNLDHEETRRAAIKGLRLWLAQQPESAEALRLELRKRYPADDVPVLYELLWGYSEEDLRVPAKSQQLVDWLDHTNVAIRQVVIHDLEKFTGRTMDFRANASAASRRLAIRRWREHISRSGTLLD